MERNPSISTQATSSAAGPPVRALLLAFEETGNQAQILKLEETMRDYLGWRTIILFFRQEDRQQANQKMGNVLHTLRSCTRPHEKLVVYYGGYLSCELHEVAEDENFCGLSMVSYHSKGGLHTFTESPDGRPVGLRCWDCVKAVDFTSIFNALGGLQNDVLLICHGQNIMPPIKDWLEDLERVKGGFLGTQNFQLMTIPGAMAKVIRKDQDHRCVCGSDRDYSDAVLQPEPVSDWTGGLIEQLQAIDFSFETTVVDLAQALGEWYRDRDVCALGLNTYKDTGPDKFRLTKLAALGPLARSTYNQVRVLAIHWQGVSGCHDDRRVALLTDILGGMFNYAVEPCEIPRNVASHNYDQFINNRMDQFLEAHDTRGTLLIVYYVGSSLIADGDLRGRRAPDQRGTLNLTTLQTRLRDDCQADILMLLDCCFGCYLPSMRDEPGTGHIEHPTHVMEALTSCATTIHSDTGLDHSLTTHFLYQLVMHSDTGITVDQLHMRIAQDGRRTLVNKGISFKWMEQGLMRYLHCGSSSIFLAPMEPVLQVPHELQAEPVELSHGLPLPQRQAYNMSLRTANLKPDRYVAYPGNASPLHAPHVNGEVYVAYPGTVPPPLPGRSRPRLELEGSREKPSDPVSPPSNHIVSSHPAARSNSVRPVLQRLRAAEGTMCRPLAGSDAAVVGASDDRAEMRDQERQERRRRKGPSRG